MATKEKAPVLGHGRCPIGCGCKKAVYALSGKGLAFCYCNACNSQVFARSARSDELLRANIVTIEAAPDAVIPEADPVREIAPTEPPAPAPSPAPEPSGMVVKKVNTFSWGILAGQEQ